MRNLKDQLFQAIPFITEGTEAQRVWTATRSHTCQNLEIVISTLMFPSQLSLL